MTHWSPLWWNSNAINFSSALAAYPPGANRFWYAGTRSRVLPMLGTRILFFIFFSIFFHPHIIEEIPEGFDLLSNTVVRAISTISLRLRSLLTDSVLTRIISRQYSIPTRKALETIILRCNYGYFYKFYLKK